MVRISFLGLQESDWPKITGLILGLELRQD